MHFRNTDVRVALQALADFSSFNLVVSDAVQGTITLQLDHVPWDQALHVLLQSRDLGMTRQGNVLWVAPRVELLRRQQQALELRKAIHQLEPVTTQGFRLHYARAQEVADQINTTSRAGDHVVRLLSPQGSLFAEPRTNQLFVTDTPDKLAQVAQLIEALDVPVRQVLIEARMVEADESFGRELAVRLGARVDASRGQASLNGGEGLGPFVVPGGSPNLGAADFSLALFNPSLTRLLNLEISANESQRNVKTLSSPKIVTSDQQRAVIEDGRKFPFLRRDTDGNTTVVFIDASLKLEVLPRITPDGQVMMQLDVKNDSPIVFNQQTAIQTKSVSTQVLVENGGTVVIGGIYVHQALQGQDQIPVLGDLPLLGNLFKSRSRSTRRSEMMVFITPRVLQDPTETQRSR